MDFADQPQLMPPRSGGTAFIADILVARLRICADAAQSLLVTSSDVMTHDAGQAASFLVSRHVATRQDGATAAIIGEPYLVADSSSSDLRLLDADGLLDLYKASGRDCLKQLQGSWAIVIVDSRQGRILLATDRMGRQPLFYHIGSDFVLIGNDLNRLKELSAEVGLDAQALYHYIYFHMVPAPDAVVEGFHKLGAACMLELTAESRDLSRYWMPTFKESATISVAAAHEELQTRLRTAVRRCANAENAAIAGIDNLARVPGDTKIGAFLSGGLDSSTVAGMLSEVQGGSGDAYSIGFEAEGYDEMPFARLAAKHFGIRLHEHYVTPDDVVRALPEIAAAFDEPFGNSSVLPAYFCARMAARDGVDVLLAGDGGDELFAGNERYASQRIFENYRRAPHWLRSDFVEPLVKNLPAGLPLVAKARSFLRQANTSLPDRLQYYSFLEQNNPDEVFSPEFLASVDQTQPLKRLNDIYHLPGEATVLNRMLFLDWQLTLADNDLRKVNQACALAGVRVRYPMLDDELVEFSTRIPSAWKLPGNGSKGAQLRHFYKQGLSGWLPDATINKTKHGFGLPFGVWMKTHRPLQEMAYDNILRLKKRSIFLPQFLDRAISSHRDGHAAYFGELVWLLMCLELWLAANKPEYYVESPQT
jgi:asparagine synthase (glutamine-hydrolysing)